jgi:hypothetical protein
MATVEPTPRPHDAPAPSGTAWCLGLAVGGAIFAFGVYGLLHDAVQTVPVDTLRWIAGSLVLHDAIIAPAVLVVGVVLTRLLPTAIGAGMQATLAVCAIVVVMSVPVLKGVGRRADNPSLLPHAYGQSLSIVISAILIGGITLTLARAARARRSAT